MNRFDIHPTAAMTVPALLAAFVLCTTGCSDGAPPADDGTATVSAMQVTARFTPPPLLADDGSVMPAVPHSEPLDAAARTRAGHYATAEQADQLESVLKARVVRIDAQDVGRLGVDTVAGIVHGLQAAGDLQHDDPVLVQGADLRLAATLANKLADDGLTRVWMVTQ